MRETLDNAARRKATELGKKHNIADIDRLTSIVKRIVTEARKVTSDKIRSQDHPLQGTYGFISSLDDALSFLPSSSAMDLFERTDPTKLRACDVTVKKWFGGEALFCTREELSHLITEFIEFLKNNKGSIVLTGSPLKSFERSHWLDYELAQLYPVNIPTSAKNRSFLHRIVAKRGTERRELEKQFVFMWLATKEMNRPLPSLDLRRKTPEYQADPLMYSFTGEEVEQIEESRMRLFNLKLAILETAHRSIIKKTGDAIDNSDFWKECMAAISNKLSRQDFQFLRNMERKYFNLRFLSLLSEQLEIELDEPTYEMRKKLCTGGISSLFDFTLSIYQELETGQMHNAKTQITQLLDDKKPRSYYQLVLSPNLIKIDTIIIEWLEGYVKNEELRKIFCRRLEKDIEKQLKVSVSTTSQRYEAIKAYDQFLEKHHSIGIEVIGRLAEPLAIKRGIYPIKLPPHTRWEDITIRFVDGEQVKIKAGDSQWKRLYNEMGFANETNLKPNFQWKFLRDLSDDRGELSHNIALKYKNVKKTKSLLSRALRSYFKLNEDPFLPYKQVRNYKTRFNLITESDEDFGEFTEEPSRYLYQ